MDRPAPPGPALSALVGPQATGEGAWLVASTLSWEGVRLEDVSSWEKVRLHWHTFPPEDERIARGYGEVQTDAAGMIVAGVGSRDHLVLVPPAAPSNAKESLRALGLDTAAYSLADVTHGGTLLRLTGRGARRLLEHACPVDLSNRALPNHRVVCAPVAGVRSEILRVDASGVLSILLHVGRSFGRYVAETLAAVADVETAVAASG